MRALILMCLGLLAIACASSAPTTYAQGAPLPPRPPAFNPATDSPITTGQPGYLDPRTQVQPGPRPTRILPQTPETRREPGIWATKPPTPKDRFRPGKREHGTSIPDMLVTSSTAVTLPSEVEDGFDAMPAEQCWYVTGTTSRWTTERGLAHRVAALTEGEQLCLFYSIYYACLEGLVKGQLDALEAKYATTGRGPNNDERRLMRMAGLTRDKAKDSLADSCAGRNNSPAVKDVEAMVADSTKTLSRGTLWIQ